MPLLGSAREGVASAVVDLLRPLLALPQGRVRAHCAFVFLGEDLFVNTRPAVHALWHLGCAYLPHVAGPFACWVCTPWQRVRQTVTLNMRSCTMQEAFINENGPAMLSGLLSACRSERVLLGVLGLFRLYAAASARSATYAIARGGAAPAVVRLACPAAFSATAQPAAPDVAAAALALLVDVSGSPEVRAVCCCLLSAEWLLHQPECLTWFAHALAHVLQQVGACLNVDCSRSQRMQSTTSCFRLAA